MTVSGNWVDRDRLIESLANCAHERNCQKCLYWQTEHDCRDAMLWDVSELLKEQEPVSPKKWVPKGQAFAKVMGWYCPVCNAGIVRGDRYCHHCGRKVKWDD